MNKKIKFVCSQCGADVQEELIDEEKSNENWKVKKDKCPFCGGKIIINLITKEDES